MVKGTPCANLAALEPGKIPINVGVGSRESGVWSMFITPSPFPLPPSPSSSLFPTPHSPLPHS
jgi:hypothetical protein